MNETIFIAFWYPSHCWWYPVVSNALVVLCVLLFMTDTCTCPKLWSDFNGALLERVPVTVSFCKAPNYVRSPCRCLNGCQVGLCLCTRVVPSIRVESVMWLHWWHDNRKCWYDLVTGCSIAVSRILTIWQGADSMTAWHWQFDTDNLTLSEKAYYQNLLTPTQKWNTYNYYLCVWIFLFI